jgi:cell division protein FtsN
MRVNSRVRRQQFELALDARQVGALLVAALGMLGVAFVLGLSVGRQAAAAAPEAPVATRAALDHLDAPLAAHEEAAPELKAPQVLTDARPIEKTMPLAPAKLAPAPATDPVAARDGSSPGTPTGAAAAPAPATAPKSAPTPKSTPISIPASATKPRAAAPARTAAATAPERKGSYTIQVASSSSRADAERIAGRLAGRTPRIVTADVPGKGRFYRVQVGSFPSPEVARKQLPLLARAGVHGIVVTARR